MRMAGVGFWDDAWQGMLDLIFPPAGRCAVCDRDAVRPSLGLCADCLRRLPFIAPPICEQCGRLLRLCAAQDGSCRECAKERFFFSRARAACLYEGPTRSYLHEVKFNRSYDLGKALAGIMAAFVAEQGGFRRYQVVLPVPLHPERQADRGFNQADLMARAVAAELRRPVHVAAVTRTRQTETQSRLDRERRRKNVYDAFRVVEPGLLAGRRVLLIDDILTTGFTASECARSILRGGAVDVGVLTLANGVLEEIWHPESRQGDTKRTKSSDIPDRCLE